MAPSLFWFRRDLRLGDHPGLHEAVARGGADGVLPLFIIDEKVLGSSGPARVEFLISCLEALEQEMGSPLVVRVGEPVEVLREIVDETGVRDVVVSGDFAPSGIARDVVVEEALALKGVTLHRVSSPYAVDPGVVLSEKGLPLKVFTAFRRRWEIIGPHVVLDAPDVKWLRAPSTGDYETLRRLGGSRRPALFDDLLDGPPVSLPPGGERAALDRLGDFVDHDIDFYKERRDILSIQGTSGLSPYLRFGCIHPRTVLAASQGPGEGRTTFRSEIGWREFYGDVLFHNPLSANASLQPQMAEMEWDSGAVAKERFRQWALGQTGIPLVDAAMRQLKAEGLMHNRARMVAASFLVKHLHLDWRWGAKWFLWHLIDGDVASNQHGWQWAAGTGTDAAPFYRIFNPIAQAERFDTQGVYIHRWVPELAGIEAPGVLQPGGGVDLLHQANYPQPMIDLKQEREEALRRYSDARERFHAKQE